MQKYFHTIITELNSRRKCKFHQMIMDKIPLKKSYRQKNQGRNTNFVKRLQKKREFHQWARKNLISTNNREKIPYSAKRLQRKCTKCTFRQWIAKKLTLLKGRKKSEFCQRATEKCEFRQRKVHGKTRFSSNRCGKGRL